MQDKAVRHKCRTATHRAAVQRGFLEAFCTAFCTAFYPAEYYCAVNFSIFDILSFVFCRTPAVKPHNGTEKMAFCRSFVAF